MRRERATKPAQADDTPVVEGMTPAQVRELERLVRSYPDATVAMLERDQAKERVEIARELVESHKRLLESKSDAELAGLGLLARRQRADVLRDQLELQKAITELALALADQSNAELRYQMFAELMRQREAQHRKGARGGVKRKSPRGASSRVIAAMFRLQPSLREATQQAFLQGLRSRRAELTEVDVGEISLELRRVRGRDGRHKTRLVGCLLVDGKRVPASAFERAWTRRNNSPDT